MKKLIILAFFVVISATSFSQGKAPLGYEPKGEWIEMFKQEVFYHGYLKGLNNMEVAKKLVSIDASYYNPFFNFLHEKAMAKPISQLVALIEKDYNESHGNVAEPADARRPMQIGLNYYNSKTLDAIALAAYNAWIKDPNRKKRIRAALSIY